MNIRLSENIRTLRKAKGLTQELLAEALGVTVGAVSKWESGMTTPELGMIIELAEFFETSVDVLLGYELRTGGKEQAAARIKERMHQKQYNAGIAEAENALRKYPNAFSVVYNSASLFSMRGFEKKEKSSLRRALELYRRSLDLVEQSEDSVGTVTIQNRMAEVHLMLGESEQALALFKACNYDGLNNAAIGSTLVMVSHKPDEGLPYLSEAFWNGISDFLRITMGLANAYAQKKEYQSARDVLGWMLSILPTLSEPEVSATYLTRSEIMLLIGSAEIAAEQGDEAAAKEYLRTARERARRFEASPVFNMTGLRYYHCDTTATAFDDFGKTTMEGIQEAISSEPNTAPLLLRLWDTLVLEDTHAPLG